MEKIEVIEVKYTTLLKVQAAFDRSLVLYKSKKDVVSLAEREAYIASLIKHFELFYEVLCKFTKLFLFQKFGTDVAGSKTIFRACYEHKLIQETDLKQLIEIVEVRNTAAVYDEEVAKKVGDAIAKHYEVLNKLFKAVKPSVNLCRFNSCLAKMVRSRLRQGYTGHGTIASAITHHELTTYPTPFVLPCPPKLYAKAGSRNRKISYRRIPIQSSFLPYYYK